MTQTNEELSVIANNAYATLDNRLQAQALMNLRLCEKSAESYENYSSLDKKDLLQMLQASSKLMAQAADKINKQRGEIMSFQTREINRI